MSATQGLLRPFNQIEDNPVLLDKTITEPVCEGLNQTLSSFQGLALQYQKHHCVVSRRLARRAPRLRSSTRRGSGALRDRDMIRR